MKTKQKKSKPNKMTRSMCIKTLDNLFSKRIRLRDADNSGNVICPLCNKKMKRGEAQNMHFIKRSCYRYRRNESNCHAGCYVCNCILNGNYIVYTRRMQNRYGVEVVDDMIQNSKKLVKISTPELLEKIEYYKNLVQKEQEKIVDK